MFAVGVHVYKAVRDEGHVPPSANFAVPEESLHYVDTVNCEEIQEMERVRDALECVIDPHTRRGSHSKRLL
jgi:hypothetical protein